MHDVRILNGTVVSDGIASPLDVAIDGDRIAEVAEPGSLGAARMEIDATGLQVLPGVIDVHFHCRAPSRPDRGDFASETAAAAAGGVTTVFEMPISDPACSTPEVFLNRRALAAAQAHVNVGLYSGAALGGAVRTNEMAELGAIGFKLFTIAPAPGREREFEGLWATDEGEILEALEGVSATGLVCVIHAENDRLINYFGHQQASNGIPLRPPVIEATAIASVAALAKEAQARIHIAHVSSRAALDAFRAALALGADVSAETCPQYLSLDDGAVRRNGGAAKIAPPLRKATDVEALWDALAEGTLPVVASDHSPFLLEEKVVVPYARAPQGLPTVELLVPVVLDGAVRSRLPITSAVAAVTSAPAKRFGLYPNKGVLAPGADADVTVVALGDQFRPGPDALVTRAAACGIVFEGMTLGARVVHTIVNGTVVFSKGRVIAANAGRFTPGHAVSMERV